MDDLQRAILAASKRAEVRAAVESLYGRLAAEIADRKPRCDASGRCCRFDAYGHRLYATTAELAAFLHHLPSFPRPAEPSGITLPVLPSSSDGCPFQIDNLCSVHPIRPFGCRIFFCDPASTQWQQDRYEHFHRQLQHLHQQFDIPYFYVEWRTALRSLHRLPELSPVRPEVEL